jgi:HSP20 family protein
MNQEWDKLFRQMDEWMRAMDRFMAHVAGARPPTPSFIPTPWRPAINVYETEEEVVVLAELAGVDSEDVMVQFEPGRLRIWGQRREVMPERVKTVHRMEIQSGPFAFEVPLPTSVDPDRAEASCKAGLLEVRLPKRSVAQKESISVPIHPAERSS